MATHNTGSQLNTWATCQWAGSIRDFIACTHPQKADVVADYVAAVMSGMSADARAGHPPERLAAVADMATLAIRAMLEPTPA